MDWPHAAVPAPSSRIPPLANRPPDEEERIPSVPRPPRHASPPRGAPAPLAASAQATRPHVTPPPTSWTLPHYVTTAAGVYDDLAAALMEEVEAGGAVFALDACARVDRARAFLTAARHNVPATPPSLTALAAAVTAMEDGGGADAVRAVRAAAALGSARAALEAEGAWGVE